MGTAPEFLAGPGLALDAFQFAAKAHRGQRRKGDGSPYIEHPVEVARLLHAAGLADERLLAAAFLHDVVEDTDIDLDQLEKHFGEEVAALVDAMTEDKSVQPYVRRKDHHRDQVAAFGAPAVCIYTADKLANLRSMREIYAVAGERAGERFKAPIDVRIDLWRSDLALAQQVVPELELVEDFGWELEAFEAERKAHA